MKARHFHYITLLTFLLIIVIFGFGVSNVNSIMELIYTKSEICNKDFLPRIGTFGDSAGLLNALFSSFAFGGVILTIIWQVSENSRQRKDEHRIQFENVFFNMTSELERIVSELRVDYEKPKVSKVPTTPLWDLGGSASTLSSTKPEDKPEYITGRAVFKYLYEDRPLPLVKVIRKEGIEGFEREMYGMLDNYFRYLYRIIKYIDESTLVNNAEKYGYAGILRAHLSYMELIMVYYNCLSEYGFEKFKPLVEKYHLLKNIREDKLHNFKRNGRVIGVATEDMYDDSAWNYDKKEEIKKNTMNSFCWRMAYAILLALIFNTLVADWWYENIIKMWEGMSEVTVRGIALIAFTLSLMYYRYCRRKYDAMFAGIKMNDNVYGTTCNVLRGNYTLPAFVFLMLASLYTNLTHQVTWLHSHTIYLDLTFFYFPLMADVIALIRSIVKKENKAIGKGE